MSEKTTNQSEITRGIFKVLKSSVGITLIALFSLQGLCIGFGLLFAGGGENIVTVVISSPIILFVSLSLTIFLVLQERVSRSSRLVQVSLGAILILLSVGNAYYLLGVIDFFLYDFLNRDSALHLILAYFIIGMLVSLWYFLYQKFQSRSVVTIHVFVTILFMVFFIFQITNVRRNQALVVQTSGEFRQAIEEGNHEDAYQLMSPSYRMTHTVNSLIRDDYFLYHATQEITMYRVEYSFWSNKAYIIYNISDITKNWSIPPPIFWRKPNATFWDRPTVGVSLELEFVNGQWLFTGQTGLFFIECIDCY